MLPCALRHMESCFFFTFWSGAVIRNTTNDIHAMVPSRMTATAPKYFLSLGFFHSVIKRLMLTIVGRPRSKSTTDALPLDVVDLAISGIPKNNITMVIARDTQCSNIHFGTEILSAFLFIDAKARTAKISNHRTAADHPSAVPL